MALREQAALVTFEFAFGVVVLRVDDDEGAVAGEVAEECWTPTIWRKD